MADEDESAGATRLENERPATRRLLVGARIAPCSETQARAVRDACYIGDEGVVWRESYASDAWLVSGTGAKVTLSHDGEVVGHVARVFPNRGWHVAELAVEVTAEQCERFHCGQAVSIDAHSLKRDDDRDLGIRRHRQAKLDAVAVLTDGEKPVYPEATIFSISELRERRAAKATALDPDLAGITLKEGDVVIDHQRGTQHRYQGGRLVPV